MSAYPDGFDPDAPDYRGPRCPACNAPCSVWFGPAPGRWCPVCDGKHEGEYRVYCTVLVKAGTAELALERVIEALTAIGRMVTAEPGRQGETR